MSEEKLKILVLIRERQDGFHTERWTDLFYVPANDVAPGNALDRLRQAVDDYLMTDAGQMDIGQTSHDFNWGDAVMSLRDEDWAKYDVFPLSESGVTNPGDVEVPEGLRGKVVVAAHDTFAVDQDEVLISDAHEQAFEAREENIKPKRRL